MVEKVKNSFATVLLEQLRLSVLIGLTASNLLKYNHNFLVAGRDLTLLPSCYEFESFAVYINRLHSQ